MLLPRRPQAKPYLEALFAAATVAAESRGGALQLLPTLVPSLAWLLEPDRLQHTNRRADTNRLQHELQEPQESGTRTAAAGPAPGVAPDVAPGVAPGGYTAVVVAAGAAVLTLPELRGLPLITCGGARARLHSAVPFASALSASALSGSALCNALC